jgi:serine protease AprX
MSKILRGSVAAGLGMATVIAVGGVFGPARADDSGTTVDPTSSSGPGSSGSNSSSNANPNATANADPNSAVSGDAITGDAITSTDWGDVTPAAAEDALNRVGDWSAARDVNSLYSLETNQGITAAWANGATGKNVTVAVIDTGIAPVPGLDGKDKVTNGPDLSFDGQAKATRYVDAFGHGTHLAGIIAGRDAGWDRKNPNPGLFAGVAPEAKLLNVKVGSADGGADVSQVIAAIDWVRQHRKDDGMNVRVITLAYGTESVQPWQVDPLAHAVENAWRAGIVVVAAAGNSGLASQSLLMPAIDPRIIAVGASDTNGTDNVADDTVADFTNGGNAARRPDVVAPGRSVVSLRVPGSYADTMSPEGRVAGDTTGRFFRGSGTSQATAFVAGEAALLLDARPSLTPDQVKAILVRSARPLAGDQPAQGAGLTDLTAAAASPTPSASSIPQFPASTGLGSLEASRGGHHVVDPVTQTPLTGEVDTLGGAWNPAAWAKASADGKAWSKGSWNGRVWTGEKFKDGEWLSVPWSGSSWGGTAWSAYGQTSAEWVASSWRAGEWEASSWRASSWRGLNWEASSWREESWLASSWRALF